MKRLLGILWSVSLLLAPNLAAETYQDNCANLIGTCDYYACIDQERLSCGRQGYALGFVKKYCEKFTAMDFREALPPLEAAVFPVSGNEWRDNVRTCLQQRMEQWFASDAAKDCRSMYEFGFNSHPECYTEKSSSFCELTPENVVRIGLTIQLNDLVRAEVLRQMRDTARICMNQLDERIGLEERSWVRLSLQEYRKIWVLVSADPTQFPKLLQVGR